MMFFCLTKSLSFHTYKHCMELVLDLFTISLTSISCHELLRDTHEVCVCVGRGEKQCVGGMPHYCFINKIPW